MTQKKIYLLEDDADIRELIEYLLENGGYKVVSFAMAKDFNTKIEKELADLFILDVSLPDGNGLDIAKELITRGQTGSIPVLLMSANVHNKVKAEESGVHGFISKPFDVDELLTKVKLLTSAS